MSTIPLFGPGAATRRGGPLFFALERLIDFAATILLIVLLAFIMMAFLAEARAGEAPRGGLFFKGEKPGSYYLAPTVATDVAMSIDGLIARVTVRQHFVNPSGAWLEGLYVFPLPERSAVDHLVMEIGDRRITGQIKERKQAEAAYKAAAAAGQRASLVSSERPNIFTTAVANVGPGEEIVVEIQYQDSVAIDGGIYSLRFPMVVGPRYIPGHVAALVSSDDTEAETETPVIPAGGTDRVPDAARITPPVLHPSLGKINPVTITIDFAPGFATERIISPYHPIAITALDEGQSRITLVEGEVPADRDFVLEWEPAAADRPIASLFAEERAGDVYLYGMITPPDDLAGARQPRDVVFVIDTSGSMGGESIDQAKRALSLALDRLAPGDRFNVIQFNNLTDALYGEPRAWNAASLREAQAFVAALEANGGTEMQPALRLALSGDVAEGRLKQVVFLTDAAVGNEVELFDDIARRLGAARLFTIGIGAAPNSYFMRKAAELGRGGFTYIGDIGEVSERMSELLRRLDRPALTGIALDLPEALAAAAEIYPATLPDLYLGRPVDFTLRLPGATIAGLSGEVALSGIDGDQTWRVRQDLSALQPAAGVAAVWARHKLSAIEDQQYRGVDSQAVRGEAIRHALAYELVSSYTSLVAIDDEIARPRDETLTDVKMATNLPKGWDYDKVFGEPVMRDGSGELPPPNQLMREINFTGTPLEGLSLPTTATPAMLHLLIGLALLIFALASWRRGPRARQWG